MKKTIITLIVLGVLVVQMTSLVSCYNNKADIVLPDSTVSFTKAIVPIFVSGGCGCHNMSKAISGSANPTQFSNGGFNGKDTIQYDAILARAGAIESWINGGKHPGGGGVYLTPLEIDVLKHWIAQGAQDDRSGGGTGGNVTYTKDIVPIISTVCSGSSCHGGAGPTFSYNKLVGDKDILSAMAKSKGVSGHPGGKISLSTSVSDILSTWVINGTPQ